MYVDFCFLFFVLICLFVWLRMQVKLKWGLCFFGFIIFMFFFFGVLFTLSSICWVLIILE